MPQLDLDWLNEELSNIANEGLRRERQTVCPLNHGRCQIDGQILNNFASNDYLDLAGDPRLISAAIEALESVGVGARASPLVCGRTEWHERLEERIARFEQQQAALLFPTGMAANIGTVSALVGPSDAIFCDRWNHASLVDGCRLSGAFLRVYRHSDLSTLKRELEKSVSFRRRWIITDAVFSMDGDLAPLDQLCDLAEQYDAQVIVDEAHGTGVFGASGRGVAEKFHVESRVAVRIGTLSKAVGTLGGFVAGQQELIDYLWNRARSQIYSTALPPSVCAAAIEAFNIIEREPDRREKLWKLSSQLRCCLETVGIDVLENSTGPIIPINVGDPNAAVRIASDLRDEGFLVGAIRPPTVPKNTSRLRVVVTSGHSEKAVQHLGQVLSATSLPRSRSL